MLGPAKPSQIQPLWRDIRMSGNPALGDDGIIALANALPPTLESCWLCRTGCGDDGFCTLLAALKRTRIKQLGFDMNAVGEAGWHCLAKALQRDGTCSAIWTAPS